MAKAVHKATKRRLKFAPILVNAFPKMSKSRETRDSHIQTPQKDLSLANRRSKAVSDGSKKPQKISKKSLNSAFTAVSEDISVFDWPKDLTDFSSISEISDDNQPSESAENMTASLLSPAASPASETVATSDLTPLSSTITSYTKSFASTSECENAKSDPRKLSCVEAELVVKHLKAAQLQIFKAKNIDLQSKRFLDALVNVMIQEFEGIPEDRDLLNELISKKANLVFLSFLLWIIAVSVIFFFYGSQHAFSGATPT